MDGGLRYGRVPGPKPAFEDLYRDYLDRIYGFLRSQLGSAADAEDVTSRVFMKAYEAYDRFEPRHETPAAWLFQIARSGRGAASRSSGPIRPPWPRTGSSTVSSSRRWPGCRSGTAR